MIKYNKILLFLLVPLTFLLLTIPAEAKAKKVFKIAGDKNYPPYEYVDENGNYKGFNVDIMRAIAIELGLDIELIPMNWNEALKALEAGEVDAIQGMTKTKIREDKFSFSKPLIVNSQAIFVRKDTNYISELANLAGRTVALQAGDISIELVIGIPNVTMLVKEDQQLALEALLAGEAEAFVGNRLTGFYILQKEAKTEQIKIAGEPLSTTEYSAATLKGETEVINLINEGIDKIKVNGTYNKIYAKWFGESFTDKSRFWKGLLIFSVLVLLLVSIFVLMIISLNKRLKIEVEARTKELAKANMDLQGRQEELEQSNRLRGKILESTLAGIIAFSQEGKVLTANSASRFLLGQDISVGTPWNDLKVIQFIDEDDFQKALQGQLWRKDIEWGKGEAKLFMNCTLIPVKDPSNIVEDVILVMHNYTEEKKLKDALYHNDKMQALGRLTAGIAHEVRNPLTAIKAYIDILPIKFDNPDFREKISRSVPQEIQRLNNLLGVLLDYANPKASAPTKFSLDMAVEEVLLFFSIQLDKKKINLENKCPQIMVWADFFQVKQVLINILLNSIEAVEIGGRISIGGSKDGRWAVLKIKDDGCGIPPEALDKIFEPFYTLKTNGYGLGLPICDHLIKDNKGKLALTSNFGEGTTANIYLPLAFEEGEVICITS